MNAPQNDLLVKRLRYMGRQYTNGQVSRGGRPVPHLLEQAADRLERLERALEQIAATTGSEDPCRKFVDIARKALGDGA